MNDSDSERAGGAVPLRMWLIGCGAMGGALLSRWLEQSPVALQVTIIDPDPRGVPEGFAGRIVPEIADAAQSEATPDLLVLAIKPQALPDLIGKLAPHLRPSTLMISMLAGVRTTTLSHLFPAVRLVRIMPNTPARIGQGITAMLGANLEPGDADIADSLLKAAGETIWLDDEQRFDAVTALSGSGPAFLFRFIEALQGAGESLGLDPAAAASLALGTVTGAAALIGQTGEAPIVLRQQVTSPNGVTQAGLDVLDGDGALSTLLRSTLRAAAERSRALALAADAAADTGIIRQRI